MIARARFAAAIAGLALAAGAAAAHADETIYAGPPNRFVDPTVTIDQGEHVTFSNLDSVAHDVTAKAKGPDAKPLFASELTAGGRSNPVVGTQYLTTGAYDFICTIHPFMTGTLTVTSAGKPEPRPAPGSKPPPPPTSSDKTAPALAVKVLDRRRSVVSRHHSLRVRVTSDEASTVGLTARAGDRTIANAVTTLDAAGATTASMKLTKAGRRMLRKHHSLRVKVSARAADAAGNASKASAARRLR